MERYNVASKLVDTLVESGEGDRVAVYYLDRTYTRRQLFDIVNRAGNALLDLGVRV